MLLEGLQLPLTTPFYPDGRLNLLKLEHNAARYSKTPVAGLVALSDFGEATTLSDEETRHALRSVADATAAEKVLMAGVSRDSVAGTLELAESAAKLGYDAVLVKRPSLFRSGADGEHAKELRTYFQAVADRSALPVVLYSPGSGQGGLLTAEIVIGLAGHPRIIGLVDGFGRRERFEALRDETLGVKREISVTAVFAAVTGRMQARNGGLISTNSLTGGGAALAVAPAKMDAKTRTKVIGFQILAGSTAGMLEGLQAGAVGAMPGFAASAPQACYEVLAAWKDEDEGLAEEKQARLEGVAERVEEALGVAGVKFGCDLNGYFGGRPRLPLLPLTGEQQAEIALLMHGLRN
ncbi:MAG TPA: dihydrodipicolinate synthase family protein [Edaphobacter sp.]|nr:dihydrodipicolinate synthase family protein [Edaphobacter sp.]